MLDWSPLIISMKTAMVSTFITFFIGIFTARKVMKMKAKLALFFDGLFTIPLVLPPTVVGFFLLLLFGKRGVIGKFLLHINIQVIFTWGATVIAATVIAFPLMYRSAKAAFEQVDINLINAAKTLGMADFKIFWKLIMPLSLPGIISGGILSFARALGEFGATLMIAGNIPKVTQTMPLSIYMAIQGGEMDMAGIWVTVIVFISFIVVILMNNYEVIYKLIKRRDKNEPIR